MLIPRPLQSIFGGMLPAALLYLSSVCTAPAAASLVPAEAGRDVSTAFLLELTNPLRTIPKYRVGIVYADSGIGLLVAPKGAPPMVEYIAGTGQDNKFGRRQLVDAAIEQVRNPQTNDFRFHVTRKTLTANNCPQLRDIVTVFYSALEASLTVPIDLAVRPTLQRAIVSDAGDYRIQIAHDGAALSLSRLGETGHPLARQESLLNSALYACIDNVQATAEQEYTFSYQQAFVRPDTTAEKPETRSQALK